MFKSLLLILIGCFGLAFAGLAQQNEGYFKLKKTVTGQSEQLVTWYFKADKLACLVEMSDKEGKKVSFRLGFDRAGQKLHIDYLNGNSHSVPVSAIAANPNASALSVKTLPNNGNDKLQTLEIMGQKGNTTAQFSTEALIDWAAYQQFIKDDVLISAMIQTNQKGLPYSYTSRNLEGQQVAKLELVELKFTKVEDSYFR